MTLEWSTNADASAYSVEGKLPLASSSAWVPKAGTAYYPGSLPDIMHTDASTSTDVTFPAYLVLKDIMATKADYIKYEADLVTYNAAKKTWDDSVKALSDFYTEIDAMPML